MIGYKVLSFQESSPLENKSSWFLLGWWFGIWDQSPLGGGFLLEAAALTQNWTQQCEASKGVQKVNSENDITLCLICFLGFLKMAGGRSDCSCSAKHFAEFICEVGETKLALSDCSLTSEKARQPQIPQAGWVWVVPGEGAEVFLAEALPAAPSDPSSENVFLRPDPIPQPQPPRATGTRSLSWGPIPKHSLVGAQEAPSAPLPTVAISHLRKQVAGIGSSCQWPDAREPGKPLSPATALPLTSILASVQTPSDMRCTRPEGYQSPLRMKKRSWPGPESESGRLQRRESGNALIQRAAKDPEVAARSWGPGSLHTVALI